MHQHRYQFVPFPAPSSLSIPGTNPFFFSFLLLSSFSFSSSSSSSYSFSFSSSSQQAPSLWSRANNMREVKEHFKHPGVTGSGCACLCLKFVFVLWDGPFDPTIVLSPLEGHSPYFCSFPLLPWGIHNWVFMRVCEDKE